MRGNRSLCNYGHTKADHDAVGACKRPTVTREVRPTLASAADATAEAREQIARVVQTAARGPMTRHTALGVADAVLACPAVAEALAAAETLRRVRAEHQPVPAEDVGPGGPYPRDMCSCGEQFYDDCDVRRAVDGEP